MLDQQHVFRDHDALCEAGASFSVTRFSTLSLTRFGTIPVSLILLDLRRTRKVQYFLGLIRAVEFLNDDGR